MWGCDGQSVDEDGSGDFFEYELGPIHKTRRCPNALIKSEFVQEIALLHAGWKRGVTPNGQGMNEETSVYWEAMNTLDNHQALAFEWFQKEKKEQ